MYLAKLCKLSQLIGSILEEVLMCAFMAGLPTHVKQLLCTASYMQTMILDKILAWAKAIMKYKLYLLWFPPNLQFGDHCYYSTI